MNIRTIDVEINDQGGGTVDLPEDVKSPLDVSGQRLVDSFGSVQLMRVRRDQPVQAQLSGCVPGTTVKVEFSTDA